MKWYNYMLILMEETVTDSGGKVIEMENETAENRTKPETPCETGGEKKIGYCGNHCDYCFYPECPGCRSNNPFCSYATLFDDHKCPNVTCCNGKGIEGCWQCGDLENCSIGFFSSGENDAKAYALFIKKYGKEKYTETILDLQKKGYNYSKSFKEINDVKRIYSIFEKSLRQEL